MFKKYKLGNEFKKSNVVFNEQEHTYILGEKKLNGITGLINKHFYGGEKYGGVPQSILENARKRGKLIHEEIERFYKFGEIGFTDELHDFIKLQKLLNLSVLENEFTVDNGEDTATNIDLILYAEKLILCDIKTTATLDIDYLSWQLSINAYLFERQTNYQVDELWAFWTRSGEFKEVPRKADAEIEKLFKAERNGEIYEKSTENLKALQVINQKAFVEIQAQIQSQKAMLELLEQKQEQMKAQIIEVMKTYNVKSYDMGEIKITYVAPTTKTSLDSKTLKAEMPEVYEKYKRETEVKEQLRITVKREKE